MPHRTRTLKSRDKDVSMILPATFQWKDTIPELNAVNAAFGLKEVSPSNLSKIRTFTFSEFDAKKPGDNFARCATKSKKRQGFNTARNCILFLKFTLHHSRNATQVLELLGVNGPSVKVPILCRKVKLHFPAQLHSITFSTLKSPYTMAHGISERFY